MAIDMTGIQEKYVSLTHGRTRYFEAGSGYPTILLHGHSFISGADNWLGLIGPLAHRVRVLAVDALNWGPGDILNQDFSFSYLVDHVREFQDALGIETANVMGQGMGGWTATLLAYESPHRVNKLVLFTPGGTASRQLPDMMNWKPPTPEQVRTQIESRFPREAGWDTQRLVKTYASKAQNQEHVTAFARVTTHMNELPNRERYNTLRRLPYISAPTLILWPQNFQTNPLPMGEDLNKGIKASRLVILDNSVTLQTQPDVIAKEILNFL